MTVFTVTTLHTHADGTPNRTYGVNGVSSVAFPSAERAQAHLGALRLGLDRNGIEFTGRVGSRVTYFAPEGGTSEVWITELPVIA